MAAKKQRWRDYPEGLSRVDAKAKRRSFDFAELSMTVLAD
ncbi:hypothetical protein GRAN_1332 [Granulicella sibirica]|uniref:Uncharacterized protein n=1 Tax=Granulicella sibirica TaxID=2479048 RepID=A0A4Q0T4X5_9BACT|nr:hypothetical protein GRAN_1332 [Granulicella sibirica]